MSATLTPSPPTTSSELPQPSPSDNSHEVARERAIKQIQRRRQFYVEVMVSAIVMVLVAVIWATTEYNNAGGWPTNGFSQSSGIHDTWNLWIIYPFIGWVLFLAVRSWAYYKGTSISESEIQREIERQAGRR